MPPKDSSRPRTASEGQVKASPVQLKRAQAGPDGKVKVGLTKDGQVTNSVVEQHKITNAAGYQQLPTSEKDAVDDANGNAGPQQTCGEHLLDDTKFQSCMAMLIVSNALVIGLETDIEWNHWDAIENLFLFLFTCELVLKLSILGPFHMFRFSHPDFHWNAFDMFIVGLGLFDYIMTTFLGSSSGGFATIFRIIRLLRILRIFRIIKFLKQLYLLAFGLVEATKAVFWVAILMAFVLYVCSIVLVKTIGRPPDSDPHAEFMNYHFGTIIESMLTLFVLMSSPNLPAYQDEEGLLAEKPFFGLFLVGFITFGSFGIIAMLTGVISESMFEKNEMRKEEAKVEHEAMRKCLGDHANELFQHLEVDANGDAKSEDVMTLVPEMAGLLEAAGGDVDHADMVRMIENMDTDGGGTVNAVEFVHTMEKISEGLSPLGLQEVHHEVGIIWHEVEMVRGQLEVMQGCLNDICQAMNLPGASAPENAAKSQSNSGTPAQRPGTQVDFAGFSDILSKHTQAIHTEMARQCKELAASHERTFRGLCNTRQLAEAQSTSGQDLSSSTDQNRLVDTSARFPVFDSLGGESQGKAQTMIANSFTRLGNADRDAKTFSPFSVAAEAAKRRLGLTPDSTGQQLDAWPLENENGKRTVAASVDMERGAGGFLDGKELFGSFPASIDRPS